MSFEKLTQNCIFAYAPEIEPLFGVFSLLGGEDAHRECSDIYGEKQINAWKNRYHFLFETFGAVQDLMFIDMFDLFLDILPKPLTLQSFRDCLMTLPEDARLFRMVDWRYYKISREEILQALWEDAGLDLLYSKTQSRCPSYLGLSTFIRQNDRFLRELFELAGEMDTSSLKGALATHTKNVEDFKTRITDLLATNTPLEASQTLMGKTFRNRGPYELYYFAPSLLLPGRCFRFFYENGTKHNQQLLFYSIREEDPDPADTVAALKALSDETRYRILKLLSDRGPMKGQDMVKELQLAPSTISHHMTELKEAGLITEEPVKTAKYYGLASGRINELLQRIREDLHP